MKLRPLIAAVPLLALAIPAAAQPGPTTEFEDNGGSAWTTHDGEVSLLESIAADSPRVEVDVIGETLEGRPIHLVRIGEPVPHSLEAAQNMPVELHICSQHGNEPAGREACLISIRNLAFTDDATLIQQMADQVTLFVPAANPDGREANTRGNSKGTDLNRNHLQVQENETRAVGRVIRDWKPVMNMDHHEYGPAQPVTYDDDLLVLWPRNLNVHKPLRDMAYSFSIDFMTPCVEGRGWSMDEYGIAAVDTPFQDFDLQQTAGDWDDGISRNAGGLRHSLGILIESVTSANPLRPEEADTGALQTRRAISQVDVIDCTLEWMRANGQAAFDITRQSMAAKAQEGLDRSDAVYFDGQDEDTTPGSVNATPTSFADPPPCGFLVDGADVDEEFFEAIDVHGITAAPQADGSSFVSMAQTAEPVIGLLLDDRGERHLKAAEPLDDCDAFVQAGSETPSTPADEPATPETPTTGGGLLLAGLAALAGARTLRRN